ncbi:anti-sigma-K factor RskA [Rhodopseudomonas rhenobacensis]|uniref:Anti-sigma-K factor RskA n=1 Tax=Rhodopseudomonas rhenobacensis TaxID=87461 RepID=A0A7W7Z4B0_9BRAD|nr:hypothetical protein [Rhodopseudomonas rhenobacensis]MBB5047770.1 anti-sigma-K factor RskA [Rhodopseudomonas rhenobacensis]
MVATNKKIQHQPGAIADLLPWHAAGTLDASDARAVEAALASDPELAKQFAAIRDESAAIIHLDESLGAPSRRAMDKLFAAIDAEPSPQAAPRATWSELLTRSPRLIAGAALAAALALLVQAGIIGALALRPQPVRADQAAALDRDAAAQALVRFTPAARVDEIGALLESYRARIVDGSRGGVFRLQFDRAMPPSELDDLMTRMQAEPTVSLAVAAPEIRSPTR